MWASHFSGLTDMETSFFPAPPHATNLTDSYSTLDLACALSPLLDNLILNTYNAGATFILHKRKWK